MSSVRSEKIPFSANFRGNETSVRIDCLFHRPPFASHRAQHIFRARVLPLSKRLFCSTKKQTNSKQTKTEIRQLAYFCYWTNNDVKEEEVYVLKCYV